MALTRHDRGVAEQAWYHADGLGNVTALVNAAGRVVARYQYEPFGQMTGQSGSWSDVNPMRFSSKEFQPASGLYAYGFRFYDPGLAAAGTGIRSGEMGGVNLYHFVHNSPGNYIDINGEIPLPIVGGAVGGRCRRSCRRVLRLLQWKRWIRLVWSRTRRVGGSCRWGNLRTRTGHRFRLCCTLRRFRGRPGAFAGQELDMITGRRCEFDAEELAMDAGLGVALGGLPGLLPKGAQNWLNNAAGAQLACSTNLLTRRFEATPGARSKDWDPETGQDGSGKAWAHWIRLRGESLCGRDQQRAGGLGSSAAASQAEAGHRRHPLPGLKDASQCSSCLCDHSCPCHDGFRWA